MTLRMDKAGRVILPKPVRDRLGSHEGSDLEIVETSDGVVLKPIDRRPSMVKKQGLWVHTAKLPPAFDLVHAIREDREDRIRKLSGLLRLTSTPMFLQPHPSKSTSTTRSHSI